MIRVDRGRVAIPNTLQSGNPGLAAAIDDLRAFFGAPIAKRRQTRYKFANDLYREPDVRGALIELFNQRCAYCEQVIDRISSGNVDRFRSRTFVSSLDGSISEDHYWWLAYEWSNLYLTCTTCGRLKGNRFPVKGTRCLPNTFGEALTVEQPLLIDPCVDDPDEHLLFGADGMIAGRTERGKVTIDVIGLGRSELVNARAAHLQALQHSLNALLSGDVGSDWPTAIRSWIGEEGRPFVGASRQIAAQILAKHAGVHAKFIDPAFLAEKASEIIGAVAGSDLTQVLIDFLPTVIPGASQVRQIFSASKQDARGEDASKLDDESATVSMLKSTKCIERVVIKDFRKIHDLDLDLTRSKSATAPWTILLGENGAGKSSILQAIALALIGEKYQRRLGLDAKRFIRSGARSSRVEVYLSNAPPVIMEINQTKGIKTNLPHWRVLLLGYGATRLLPQTGSSKETVEDYAKVDNLFDPFVPVKDPEKWLVGLPRRTFDICARALKELFILLDGPERLVRRKDHILIETKSGAMIPLRQLSDGYQSIIGVTADIMQVVLRYWQGMETAEGLVLIDELGAHLHPRWRMRVVTGLRRAFPFIQFVVSTHDPLCLRGLEDGEVIVLKEDARGRTVALADLPSVRAMRVEQLLTSEHFGLHSTLDPELDAEFTRYYELRSKGSVSPEEQQELSLLKSELDGKRVLGVDRRERLMLEAIDDYLATEKSVTNGAQRARMRESTKRTVSQIWASELP